MTQFAPPEIWKRQAVLFGIHKWRLQYEDFTDFGFQSENRFILTRMKNKPPVHITVFEEVISNMDAIPPFIFLHAQRIHTEAYTKYLEEVLLFWIERVAVWRPYVW